MSGLWNRSVKARGSGRFLPRFHHRHRQELCICYPERNILPMLHFLHAPTSWRRRTLERWQFLCRCVRCEAPAVVCRGSVGSDWLELEFHAGWVVGGRPIPGVVDVIGAPGFSTLKHPRLKNTAGSKPPDSFLLKRCEPHVETNTPATALLLSHSPRCLVSPFEPSVVSHFSGPEARAGGGP